MYQAGVAEVDITPHDWLCEDERIWLWGYGGREEPCRDPDPRSRLTARALAVKDTAGTCVVIAALDLGALDPETTDYVRQRIAAKFGIGPEYICLNVSHTHGAPVVVSIPTWQRGVALADPAYMFYLADAVGNAIVAAIENLEPAELHWARGTTDIGRSRHYNPPDYWRDNTLDVLTVKRSPLHTPSTTDRSRIATVFSAACHPVCRDGGSESLHADFPDAARKKVEQALGGTALFLQGFGGTCLPVTLCTNADANRDPEHPNPNSPFPLGGGIATWFRTLIGPSVKCLPPTLSAPRPKGRTTV